MIFIQSLPLNQVHNLCDTFIHILHTHTYTITSTIFLLSMNHKKLTENWKRKQHWAEYPFQVNLYFTSDLKTTCLSNLNLSWSIYVFLIIMSKFHTTDLRKSFSLQTEGKGISIELTYFWSTQITVDLEIISLQSRTNLKHFWQVSRCRYHPSLYRLLLLYLLQFQYYQIQILLFLTFIKANSFMAASLDKYSQDAPLRWPR